MSSAQSNPRSLKLRRRGRHAAPTQVEKIAGKATAAAPAVAIAGGVILAAPTAANAATSNNAAVSAPVVGGEATQAAHDAQAAAKAAAKATTATRTAKATLDSASSSVQSYEVQAGDTLSRISRHFYGTGADWHYLYEKNTSIISNPNEIFPGQRLDVPASAPSGAVQQPSASTSASTGDDDGVQVSAEPSHGASLSASVSVGHYSGGQGGTLGCSGLESLWEEAGGSPAEAVMAASIAMAESGGNQYAVSPTNDYGYWQINGSHGSQATFNPIGNAKAAISISSDGTNWSPWSTYTSGAYQGKC